MKDRLIERLLFGSISYIIAAGMVVVIGGLVYTTVLVYRAGCVESMLLNGVCASDPRIDHWFSKK